MVTIEISLADREKSVNDLMNYVDLVPSIIEESSIIEYDNKSFITNNVVVYNEIIANVEYDSEDKDCSSLLTKKIIDIISKIKKNTPTLNFNHIDIAFDTDYYNKPFFIRPQLFQHLLEYDSPWSVIIRFDIKNDYYYNNNYGTLKNISFKNKNFYVKDKIVNYEKTSQSVIKKRLKEFYPMMSRGNIVIEETPSPYTYCLTSIDKELSRMLVNINCRLVFVFKNPKY